MSPTQKNPPRTSLIRIIAILIAAGGTLMIVAVLISLLSARNAASTDTVPVSVPARINLPAPQLALNDLGGNPASLEAYRGRVVLVNNWATWCPPCRAEMPELEAYYTRHASQGFVLVAIESGDAARPVSAFVAQNRLTFPVWLDPQLTAVAAFNNWSLPSSYLIGRDGTMQLAWLGGIDQPTLEKYVTPLLEK